MAYDRATVEAMLSPISGIPASCKYLPSIAEIKEWLEDHAPRRPALPDYTHMLEERKRLDAILPSGPKNAPTFRQQLCETFKIRDVPPGFDTCALVQLRAQYGRNAQGFHDHIERLLAV